MTTIVGVSIVLSGATAPTVNAVSEIDIEQQEITDRYKTGFVENTVINNVQYTFEHSIEENSRIVRVINNKTNDVEIVEYSLDTNEIYLDGRMIGEVKNVDNGSSNVFNRSSWSTIDTNSEYISWAEGIGTAAIAAAIATVLGVIGGPGVIAAMGTAALGAIAAGASGGTVNYEIQRLRPSPGIIKHRYVWSFTAPTGDYYGEYVTPVSF